MAAVSPERLEAADRARQRAAIQRRRAALVAVVLIVVGLVVVVIVQRLRDSSSSGVVATPVSGSSTDLGQRPPSRVVATAGPVEIQLPIARDRLRTTLFRSINDSAGVSVAPDSSWKHHVASGDGQLGPRTAGIDFATAAGTIAFSPVDGVVQGSRPYIVAGKQVGYEIDISPKAASDVLVRVRNIEDIPSERNAQSLCQSRAGVSVPHVGEVVFAGVTCVGQVRDLGDVRDVVKPEITDYLKGGDDPNTDAINHLHIEVVRVAQ